MRKTIAVLLVCFTCIFMTGCPTKEEKFLMAENEWKKQLNYDYFLLHDVQFSYFAPGGQGEIKQWQDFHFIILSSDNIVYDTVKMRFETEIELGFRFFSIGKDVLQRGEELHACPYFSMDILVPDNIPCILQYTTTEGDEINKEYLLDFTQEPFVDLRQSEVRD